MRRLLPFLALAALLAGCGSSTKSSSTGGSIPAGASEVRAGALAFVSVNSDLGSAQWQQLDDLAQKFPGRDHAVAQLKQELTQEGVDYEQDVKPALGPEVDIAVVAGGTDTSPQVVALTKPDEPGKFKALVAKLNAKDTSGDRAVYREVDGWYALSDKQTAISNVVGGGNSLADDAAFKEAMDKLPGDALVKAYVDGPRLNAVVSASAADFASALIGGVPSDAFAFLDFKGEGTTDQLEKLKSNPQAAKAIAQLQKEYGVTLDELLSLLGGEVAFYARSGIGIPELTLALDPKDSAAALDTLDKLATKLAAETGGTVQSGTQGGHDVKTVNLGQFAIHYGTVDGKVLITSGVSGIADYGQGDDLSDSGDFKEAKDTAGMPDSTGGVIYLDLNDALPMLEGLASLSGENLPSSTTENLRPLRSFLAWSNASGETRTFDAFLAIG